MKKQKILVILGPTAVGKSDVAVELAHFFNGEVISADSRQVYKGLDIGTGKITQEEMRGVPHHLLDVADPTERYSVESWRHEAVDITQDILDRGKLPIICGGTGFYIEALVDNPSFPEVPPNEVLRNNLKNKSPEELFLMLQTKDSNRAETIDKDNPARLIRALEIIEAHGAVPEQKKNPLFETLQIGLTLPREILRERIKHRLERRLDGGMIEEAQALHTQELSYERMNELGLEYRYLAQYLTEKISHDEMKEKLETEIARYAKRQETWFKRDERIRWFMPSEKESILLEVKKFIDTM